MELTTKHFKPGFSFLLKTGENEAGVERWEQITIHQNCDYQLLDELKMGFISMPHLFKPLSTARKN